MSIRDRAAQFAPYSALSGYGDAVEETARRTDAKNDLDEYEKERINKLLTDLLSSKEDLRVAITYFRPDKRKSGGAYVTAVGMIEQIDQIKREISLSGGYLLSIDDISDLRIID